MLDNLCCDQQRNIEERLAEQDDKILVISNMLCYVRKEPMLHVEKIRCTSVYRAAEQLSCVIIDDQSENQDVS